MLASRCSMTNALLTTDKINPCSVGFRYRTLTSSCKWTPLETPRTPPRDAKTHGPSVVPDFHHTGFVRVGLYQKHWHGLTQSRSRDRAVKECISLLITQGCSTAQCPSSTFFLVVPIASLPIPVGQPLLYGHLISLFSALYTGSWLSSTSSQPRRSPNEFVPILLHSITHFTLLLVYRSSNTSPLPHREASLSNFVSREHRRNSTHSLHLRD